MFRELYFARTMGGKPLGATVPSSLFKPCYAASEKWLVVGLCSILLENRCQGRLL